MSGRIEQLEYDKRAIELERNELKRQRDALLAAAKALLENVNDDSNGPFIAIAHPKHSDQVIALRAAIEEAEK